MATPNDQKGTLQITYQLTIMSLSGTKITSTSRTATIRDFLTAARNQELSTAT